MKQIMLTYIFARYSSWTRKFSPGWCLLRWRRVPFSWLYICWTRQITKQRPFCRLLWLYFASKSHWGQTPDISLRNGLFAFTRTFFKRKHNNLILNLGKENIVQTHPITDLQVARMDWVVFPSDFLQMMQQRLSLKESNKHVNTIVIVRNCCKYIPNIMIGQVTIGSLLLQLCQHNMPVLPEFDDVPFCHIQKEPPSFRRPPHVHLKHFPLMTLTTNVMLTNNIPTFVINTAAPSRISLSWYLITSWSNFACIKPVLVQLVLLSIQCRQCHSNIWITSWVL